MQKRAEYNNQTIGYQLRLSRRAKRMRVAVYFDQRVIVTLPRGFEEARAESYLREKWAWVQKALARFGKFKGGALIRSGRREFLKYKARALFLAKAKVRQWGGIYGFVHKRVNIKNQKTRWGSCSKKGNLNFNYKIVHLPENLLDYLVVHELCHLKELNHSAKFWNLVARAIPDYKARVKEFKSIIAG